jgi:hypothetical protein
MEIPMRKLTLSAVAIAIMALVQPAARAGDSKGDVCDGDMFSEACGDGAVIFDTELTFLRYHQSGGVLASNTQPVEFGFDPAPRFVAGYERCDGLGIRGRYWFFDHSATTDGEVPTVLAIDTYNLDLEVYKRIALGCQTSLEVSGGIRYNEFDQSDSLGLSNGFKGIGGTVGLQGNHRFGNGLGLYARARWSIVQGDDELADDGGFYNTYTPLLEPDATHSQTEIGIGIDWSRCLANGAVLTVGVGGEWQNWDEFAVGRDGFSNGETVLADVGFGGFVAKLGVAY